MAFRLASRRVFRSVTTRQFATIQEETVRITFVDTTGKRATLPGRVGWTLLETAEHHKVDIPKWCRVPVDPKQIRRTDDWVENVYGTGEYCGQCLVQIPKAYQHLTGERLEHETSVLNATWGEEYVTPSSRCSCSITLDKKMDGMVVMIPDTSLFGDY